MKLCQRRWRNGGDQGEPKVGPDHLLRGCSLTDVWTQPGFQRIVKGMILLLCGRPTSRNRVGLSFARLTPLDERSRSTRTSQGELGTPPIPALSHERAPRCWPPASRLCHPDSPPHLLTCAARLDGGQTKSPTPAGRRLIHVFVSPGFMSKSVRGPTASPRLGTTCDGGAGGRARGCRTPA